MHESMQLNSIDSNRILEELTARQFLLPRGTVGEAMAASAEKLGFCPRAASRAMRWLDISPDHTMGRLRRTQLMQLAQSVHRFWRHAAALEV